MKNTNYVYITGSGHSGSTLLDLILGTHSQMFSIGEIKQWELYIRENKLCSCGKEVINCSFWQQIRDAILQMHGADVFQKPERFRFFLDSEHIHTSKARYWTLIAAAAFSNPKHDVTWPWKNEKKIVEQVYTLYDLVRQKSKKSIVVDSSKSPLLMKLLWLNQPARFKVIYLVRDGRAVLNSNLRKNKKLLFAIRAWIKSNRLVQLLSRNMGSSIIIVKYEDLCSNPEQVIKKICAFIGVDFEPEMLQFSGREIHNIDGNRMRFSKEHTIRLDERWRRELNEEAVTAFNKHAKKVNESFGYN